MSEYLEDVCTQPEQLRNTLHFYETSDILVKLNQICRPSFHRLVFSGMGSSHIRSLIHILFRKFDFPWNVCASGPGHGITASNGRLMVPVWLANGMVRLDREPSGRIKNHFPSAAGCIYSDDSGKTWNPGFLTQGIENANETSAAELRSGKILFNFRNERFEKCRVMGIARVSLDRLETVWTENQLPDPCLLYTSSGSGMRSEPLHPGQPPHGN